MYPSFDLALYELILHDLPGYSITIKSYENGTKTVAIVHCIEESMYINAHPAEKLRTDDQISEVAFIDFSTSSSATDNGTFLRHTTFEVVITSCGVVTKGTNLEETLHKAIKGYLRIKSSC